MRKSITELDEGWLRARPVVPRDCSLRGVGSRLLEAFLFDTHTLSLSFMYPCLFVLLSSRLALA
jgi:hypothetical protein